MSIANRLLLGFGAVMALMLLLGFFGLSQIGRVRDVTRTIVTRDLALIRELGTISDNRAQMRAIREESLRALLAREANAAANAERAEAAWDEARMRTNDAIARAKGFTRQYAEEALSNARASTWGDANKNLEDMESQLAVGVSDAKRQFAAMRAGDARQALALEGALLQRRSDFDVLMREARATADRGVEAGQARIESVYNESRLYIVGAIVAALAIGLAILLPLQRSVVGALASFGGFVERVGQGDLAGAPAATGADELGRLGLTLNGMVEGLKQLASQSREATFNLDSAIAQIRASTQEQAAGVEEQLAAVQETAATVDEITHAGAQVSKRAQEVMAAAQATAHTSQDGLRAVDDTARVMDTIKEQAEAVAQNIVALSEKTQAIGDIISTVNDISERSHLLALNAAIEAAAAGESGRSFAVVAAELKLLADQAKDATGQVRSILGELQRGINTSVMLTEEAVKRVAAGRDRTEATQRTIGEIMSRVNESVLTFQQIVASTNQQQLGIEQVMGALQNIRQASQQTAAGTRQLNESAGNLARLSQQLLGFANRYRL